MFARGIVAAFALALTVPAFAGTQTRTSAFEYDPATGLLTKEIIEPDNSSLCLVTTYSYDAYGNTISSTTRNCNGSSSEAAAPAGDPVFASRTSSNAFAAGSVTIAGTTYTWSAGQFATTSANPLNQSETKLYDPRFGVMTSLTGPNGLTNNWTYDSFGRRSTDVRADGTSTNWFYERCADLAAGTCPTYAQYRVRVTTTGAPTSSTYYDSLARAIRAEAQGFDGTLVMKDTQYDSLGRVAQVSRPYFAGATPVWTVLAYDILGRVTQTDEPSAAGNSARTATAYNGLVATVTISNAGSGTGLPNGVTQTKTTTKNSQGQVVQVADSQNNLLNYAYDEFGDISTTTDALGNVTALSYDTRGRKVSMVDPDMGAWSYFYNALGQLIRQTDAKGQTATMVYDLLGRMTSRTEADLVSIWTYDSCAMGIGKLCQASANNGYSRTTTYDSLGRPSNLSASIDIAYNVTTTYDSAGRVDTLTYPTGFAVQNIYNSYGYLWKVQRADAGGTTVFWQANTKSASGQVTNELLGNGLTQTRTYDALDRVTNIVASGSGGAVQDLAYTYDPIGNVSQRADNVDAVTENFSYDSLNRLTLASGPNLVTRSFNYDALGDMTYKSDVGTYTYPASGSGSVRPHAVSSVAGTVNASFNYDANGNLTSDVNRTLTYMSFNLPATIAGNNATYTYTYSPEHERVRLVTALATGTQTTIYLHPGGGGALFYEKEIKSDNTVENKHYVQAGAILVGVYVTKSSYAAGDGPQMRYYHRDSLGSIAAITNDAGAVIERLAYEAFGQRRFPNGTADPSESLFGITTDRGFTAHEHLDEIGLIHMNGRVYDPLLGRFMTPDALVQSPDNLQSHNRYAYVFNNPLAGIDPSGYKSLLHDLIHFAMLSGRDAHFPTTPKHTFEMIRSAPWQPAIDRYVMGHSWAYAVGEFAATTVTSVFCGGCGGEVWAAYYAYQATGSLNAAAKAAAITYLTSLASTEVDSWTDIPAYDIDNVPYEDYVAMNVWNVAGHAAVGCASAAASGGSCQTGVRNSLISSGAKYLYISLVGYALNGNPGSPSVEKGYEEMPVQGANNIGEQGGWLINGVPYTVGEDGDVIRCAACEGATISRSLNQVPGVNAVSGLHDMFQVNLGSLRDSLNVPGMPVAAVITYTGLLQGAPAAQIGIDHSKKTQQ